MTSFAAIGARYELTVCSALSHLQFALTRASSRSGAASATASGADDGIDLVGRWLLQSSGDAADLNSMHRSSTARVDANAHLQHLHTAALQPPFAYAQCKHTGSAIGVHVLRDFTSALVARTKHLPSDSRSIGIIASTAHFSMPSLRLAQLSSSALLLVQVHDTGVIQSAFLNRAGRATFPHVELARARARADAAAVAHHVSLITLQRHAMSGGERRQAASQPLT